MALVSGGVPDTTGPNSSVQFGQGTQVAAEMRNLQSNSGSSTPQPSPPPGPVGVPQQTAPTGPDAGPAQPAPGFPQDTGIPRGPDGSLDMSKIFSNVQTMNSWRQTAREWAQHPAAGKYIKFLGKHSRADIGGH